MKGWNELAVMLMLVFVSGVSCVEALEKTSARPALHCPPPHGHRAPAGRESGFVRKWGVTRVHPVHPRLECPS